MPRAQFAVGTNQADRTAGGLWSQHKRSNRCSPSTVIQTWPEEDLKKPRSPPCTSFQPWTNFHVKMSDLFSPPTQTCGLTSLKTPHTAAKNMTTNVSIYCPPRWNHILCLFWRLFVAVNHLYNHIFWWICQSDNCYWINEYMDSAPEVYF